MNFIEFLPHITALVVCVITGYFGVKIARINPDKDGIKKTPSTNLPVIYMSVFGLFGLIVGFFLGQYWRSSLLLPPNQMVMIPAGKFIMGSDSSWVGIQTDELPQREVYLDEFLIDTREVTNAKYAHCLLDRFCKQPNTFINPEYNKSDNGNFPVTGVSGKMPKPIANGSTSVYRLKQNGKRPRAAPMAVNTPGEMSLWLEICLTSVIRIATRIGNAKTLMMDLRS